MKVDGKITELFLEISSDIRYSILKKLNVKNQKQSQIAKDLRMTLPESHRQFQRLAKTDLIAKQSDGMYSLTSFGKIFLKHLDYVEFLLMYKNYFKSHTLGDLPSKFVKRISDLGNCDLIEGAFVLNEKMIQIASNGKYLRVISAHVPPDAFRQGLNSAQKTGKPVSIIYAKNTIIPKGFKEEFTSTKVLDLISKGTYERRIQREYKCILYSTIKLQWSCFPIPVGLWI